MMVEAVGDPYRARWGEPTRKARFDVGEFGIDVLKWDADANPEGVALYATVGASGWPMADRDPDHRVEFFVGLVPARDGIASALAALGLYPAREGVALDHGHTVPAGEPLWPGAQMRSFVVVRPRPDFLPALELRGGLHVEFFQAIPVFEAEVAFRRKYGAEALLRRWEEAELYFWDSKRPWESARER
jgi:Suppressor of fused protein (SUFU)